MIKILTIVGARPQIIKAAALSRCIRNHFAGEIREIILHTGQHYDTNMSQVFFDEMEIPLPDINLQIGSASHGMQTARMLEGIEAELMHHKPDYLVLYGDTNSTLAGAVAGAKLRIPIVHIEAGLRSFNKSMPEEINRIMCDHASTLLFVPTLAGIENLKREGFSVSLQPPYSNDHPGVFHCGDIMFDNLVYYSNKAVNSPGSLSKLKLEPGKYILCTIHRDNNTDIPERLESIFRAILRISEGSGQKVVIPLHPRTSKLLPEKLSAGLYQGILDSPLIKIIPPASYMEMIYLEKYCSLVMTDSGGVQKEAYFFRKPLIIVRPETEWTEIVDSGAGVIADADEERIVAAFSDLQSRQFEFPAVFGDGNAASFICRKLLA